MKSLIIFRQIISYQTMEYFLFDWIPMPRLTITHPEGDAEIDQDMSPKNAIKQEFGRRLQKLMLSKGWTQSELARQADIARDSVSTYVRGKSLPEPLNLERLARTLGVTPLELLPVQTEIANDADIPSLELKISSSNPHVACLRVNRLVSTGTAMKVIALLNDDELPD